MTARRDPLSEFSQAYLLEPFEAEPTFAYRKMFGGLAIYLHDKMICLLAENPTGTTWREIDYHTPIWNGLLIPTEYEHHESLMRDFKGFQNHPVLKKWMYLPLTSPDYEMTSRAFLKALARDDLRLGVIPGKRAKRRRITRIKLKGSKK